MAGIVQRTVFISYRRVAPFHARAVYQYLNSNGYDVFMDVERMDSGAFDEILLRQIAARAHFVLLLTPGALDRCTNPNDWLRREIEHAIDMKRNIVPITFEGFDREAAAPFMTEKLSVLGLYNGLNVPTDYFDEAMARLRTRYLNIDVDAVIHPTPAADKPIVAERKAEAESAPTVTEEELTAEQYVFEAFKHYKAGRFDEGIALAHQAIRLTPDYVDAFFTRAHIYNSKGEYDRAISDFNEVIRLDPKFALAYSGRGLAYSNQDEYEYAIADYNEALRLSPSNFIEFGDRGFAYYNLGEHQLAIADYDLAIQYDPKRDITYNNRAAAYNAIGEYEHAIVDCNQAIALRPEFANPYSHRGFAYYKKGNNQQALKDLNQAIVLNPKYSQAYYRRSDVYRTLGDMSACEADLREAVRLDREGE